MQRERERAGWWARIACAVLQQQTVGPSVSDITHYIPSPFPLESRRRSAPGSAACTPQHAYAWAPHAQAQLAHVSDPPARQPPAAAACGVDFRYRRSGAQISGPPGRPIHVQSQCGVLAEDRRPVGRYGVSL
jgi:hypothetical protein